MTPPTCYRPIHRVALVALLAAQGCGGPATVPPDLVLVNAKVFTADEERPWVEAVAIEGERIVAVGSSAEMKALAGSSTRVLDLGQRTVIPGINDAHRHFGLLPRSIHQLQLTPLEPSWEETRSAILKAVAELEAGTPIWGTVGIAVTTDPKIDRRVLDQLAPEHPVRLAAFYGHGEIHNSLALEQAGIGEEEPDPPGGFFEREGGTQRLNGRMFEYAHWNLRDRDAAQLGDDHAVAVMEQLAERMLAAGITSIQDMPMLPFERYLDVLEQAAPPLRVRAIRFPTTSSGRRLTQVLPSAAAAHVTVSGTKWILDGTPLERGAALRQPYSDAPGWSGRLNFPPSEISAMLRESLAARDRLLLHVVGDRGLALLFDAMEAMHEVDWPAQRLRIEHGDTLAGELVERAGRLGVVVVQNPTHFAMPLASRFGPERAVGTLRSLLDAGIPIALGSDGSLTPWLDVMLATTHPATPSEAISVEQAVIAYTLGSAFAEGEEADKGSLRAGKLADLAVLSQDPFSVATEAIPATNSVLTIIGGEIVYDAGVLGSDRGASGQL